jgi:predicted CXXCH cytochrome family protein
MKEIIIGNILVAVSIFCLPSFLCAQMLHPNRPDAAKKCAICHFQWVYQFFSEQRDGELSAIPKEKIVAKKEMCFSCHDGSITDSRNAVFHGPGHRAGIIPSKNVTVPDTFPLDDEGGLQCATCHTPHAISSSSDSDEKVGIFFRIANTDSKLCMTCHVNKAGGPAHGNHSINISARSRPGEILQSGGHFGETQSNQIICETCHIAHGGVNNKFLVLSTEDTSRSVLCVACHGQRPGSSETIGADYGSHPVNVRAKNVRIPYKWSHGDDVVIGSHGELVCRTCHSPHGAVDKKRLLAERNYRDSLCVQCHKDKKLLAGSRHDLKIIAPNEKNIKGEPAANLGPCSPCHLVHGGGARLMWARKKQIDEKPGEFCFSCHCQGGSAEKVIPPDYSHPMDISSSSMKFLRSKMEIRCSTCHDLHNPLPKFYDPDQEGLEHAKFLRYSNEDASGICIGCHSRYAMIEGTAHDLRITAPDFKNVYGETAHQGGLCSPCHVAHNAAFELNLWSAPMGPALLEGWNRSYTTDNNIMTKLCTGCHAPGQIAEKHIPEFGLHPMEKVVASSGSITYDMSQSEFPIYTDTGVIESNGNIVCSTCHNPHQWDPHVEAKGLGKEVEGDVTNSFLRPDLHSKFCTACHGKEGLIEFKYFHSHTGRQKKEAPFSSK